MMRAVDAAIYSRATKFLLEGGRSENSTQPCRPEILNCGDGVPLISARRRNGVLKGILARARRGCGPPRQHRLEHFIPKNEAVKQGRQDMQSDEPEQHPSRNRMDLVKEHSERLVASHDLRHLPCKQHEVAPARQTSG
jgi:hypothetical protein